MITVAYQSETDRKWHTTNCNDRACFANWKLTFGKVVRGYKAVSNYRVIEEKKPVPFFVTALKWMGW